MERVSSPNNLMNRLASLRGDSNISLFTGGLKSKPEAQVPELVSPGQEFRDETAPNIDDLIENVETKLKRNLAKEGALDVLVDTVSLLKVRLAETDKPESLAKIAKEMSGVIGQLNEGEAPKSGSKNQGNIVIWKPVMVQEVNYETVIARDE